MAIVRLKAPRFPAIEVRLGIRAKLSHRPPLGSIGTQKDAVGGEMREVTIEIGRCRGLVPIVQNRAHFIGRSLSQ